MNTFEFVIAIIFLTGTFWLIRHSLALKHRRNGTEGEDSHEAQRLREEVHQLKERLKVLERITVEKENSLAKEIESLRDR
jgi:hypothetical protein